MLPTPARQTPRAFRHSVIRSAAVLVMCAVQPFHQSSAADASAAAPPDFSGVWISPTGEGMLTMTETGGATADGQPVVPLLPWAREYALKHRAAEAKGEPVTNNNGRCLPPGFVRQIKGAMPFLILQEPARITFLFEENMRVIIVPIGTARPVTAPANHAWYGDSVARWEGDTLVIDTVNTYEKTPFSGGIPHTKDLKLTQRFKYIEEGKAILYEATLEDPGAYQRPWVARSILRDPNTSLFQAQQTPERKKYKFREHVCAEDAFYTVDSSWESEK